MVVMTSLGRILRVSIVCSTIWLTQFGTAPAEPDHEARLLTRIHQITFAGRRAGEGYFSADGKRMIFQSEREPDNPFYQIYLLDLETGDTSQSPHPPPSLQGEGAQLLPDLPCALLLTLMLLAPLA